MFSSGKGVAISHQSCHLQCSFTHGYPFCCINRKIVAVWLQQDYATHQRGAVLFAGWTWIFVCCSNTWSSGSQKKSLRSRTANLKTDAASTFISNTPTPVPRIGAVRDERFQKAFSRFTVMLLLNLLFAIGGSRRFVTGWGEKTDCLDETPFLWIFIPFVVFIFYRVRSRNLPKFTWFSSVSSKGIKWPLPDGLLSPLNLSNTARKMSPPTPHKRHFLDYIQILVCLCFITVVEPVYVKTVGQQVTMHGKLTPPCEPKGCSLH